LEEKLASLLLTSVPHSAGFLCRKERYHLTRTWWTLYVIRWNIRDDAIHSPGTCSISEKIYRSFLNFSYAGFFSIFHGENSGLTDIIFLHLFWRKILSKSNTCLHFLGVISWLLGWIYALIFRIHSCEQTTEQLRTLERDRNTSGEKSGENGENSGMHGEKSGENGEWDWVGGICLFEV
jgi:hypothetical protein